MNLIRATVRGAMWTIGAGVGARALGLIGTLAVTRFIAPDDYGEVSVAVVVVLTANQFSTLGFGQFLIARQSAPRSVAFHVTVFHVVLGLLALLAALALGRTLGVWFDAPGMSRYLPGLVVSGLLDRVAYVPERLLVRDLHFRAVSLARTVGDVVYSVVCVALAAMGFGGAAIVLGNVARSVLRTALFVFAVKLADWAEPSRLSMRQTRELLKFGVPMSLGAFCAFASRRWDNLLVSRFFGPGPAGMYNLAYNLADVPAIQVGEQIGDVLVPSFARLDQARRPDALVRAVTLLALVVFPLAVGLGAVAPTLVRAVFDAKWLPMAPMLVLLSALSVTRPVGWTVESYLQARELPRLILGLEAFKLVALLASIATLGRAGPLYTCVAVGVAYAAHALLTMWAVRVVDRVSFGRMLSGIGSALTACVPMIAAVLAMRHGLASGGGVPPAVGLVAEVMAGAVGYAVGTFLVARSTAYDLVNRVVDALRSHA
jgi:PST family polysaccharide transporter